MSQKTEKKQCPYCGEEIQVVAKKCRFCGEWLNKDEDSSNDGNKKRSSFIACLFIFGFILVILYGFLRPELWFIFTPMVLVWYIYSRDDFKKNFKLFLSAFLLIIGVVLFWQNFNFDTDKEEETLNTSKKEQNKEAKETTAPKKEETKQEETKKEEAGEPFEVLVTNQIVKKVDGKYRYFFDIRNKDKKDFNGSVSITLHNNMQQSPLGGENFKANSPISPDLGTSVYLEINTGTPSAHGEYGITKFKYEARIDDKIVKSGEGAITDKIEDSSDYGF